MQDSAPLRGRPDRQSPSDALAEVIAAMERAGIGTSRDELADALWLARWWKPAGGIPLLGTRETVQQRRPAAERTTTSETPSSSAAGGQPSPSCPLSDAAPVPAVARSDTAACAWLYPGAGRGGIADNAVQVGVRAPATLPAAPELQRSLRPLQRLRGAVEPLRTTLDEYATAELTAQAGGLLLPVYRPVTRGDLSMRLLMDTASSMHVWERTLDELKQMFERGGAFRDVRVRYLHEGPGGSVAVSTRFGASAAALHSSDHLCDPTGRQVTVLVSDCTGPLWNSGAAHRLLHRLSRYAPVAVLQPLPQRLWSRTRLPASHGVVWRVEDTTNPGRLRFAQSAEPGSPRPGRAQKAAAVEIPVLPLSAASLGAWARLVSGTGAGPVPASVGWVSHDQPATPASRPRPSRSPAELVARFRERASPGAEQLAVYLAAAPLYLPVMQLVQRTMLRGSGPAEMAEVLLSGLLTRSDPESAAGDSSWYEFVEGVRETLLTPLARDEALLVLKHCSEFIEQRFGRGSPNFPAMAILQLESDAPPPVDAEHRAPAPAPNGPSRIPQPFAAVAARVLERFAPPADSPVVGDVGRPNGLARRSVIHRAEALVERFKSDGMVQNLLDAVQVLRQSTGREPVRGTDPELWTALARNLLLLWRLQADATLLAEALDAATLAAAHPDAVHARTTLARVLHASASERRAAGDERTALELLRRADREYTAACAAPGLEADEALEITLERASVLEEQWVLGGYSGLLEETVGMLEAFGDAWPVTRTQPSGLSLAHGRALLLLARDTQDLERVRVYAQQAAVSLDHGRELLDGESSLPDDRARAALDLVDAQLLSGENLDRAEVLLAEILRTADDQRLRAAALARAARLRVRRYDCGSPVTELEAATERFLDACRAVPRDRPEYGDLLAEWGETLLRRAGLAGGKPFIGRTVRVLRECRMETAPNAQELAGRLLMLGRALILRYQSEGDLVDLREAEHVFEVAISHAGQEGVRARSWFALGEAHHFAFQHTRRPGRLDHAAAALRKAALAARAAQEELVDPSDMVRLAASAHHARGLVHESAGRPRAARDAYRSAMHEWHRLPAGGGQGEENTAARLAELGGQ
ncbi:SAV_2336 N-terminal domain-related protein [Streptomyces marianii]|uniref:SAV_2336 N-terminal domain-related protein n=1 Tax=Streptomyces marianii TaxID=1817406 RepID=UPI001487519B|nr:SAV_2336 N-terminal domain-related protein [Streptomyces marianii]